MSNCDHAWRFAADDPIIKCTHCDETRPNPFGPPRSTASVEIVLPRQLPRLSPNLRIDGRKRHSETASVRRDTGYLARAAFSRRRGEITYPFTVRLHYRPARAGRRDPGNLGLDTKAYRRADRRRPRTRRHPAVRHRANAENSPTRARAARQALARNRMGDNVNAAEIRELAIDRATEAMLGKVYRIMSFAVSQTERDAAREIATWVVDGLGDLLPTSASYGAATEPIGKRWLTERPDEPTARYLATRANAIPVRRYVGDWHAIDEQQPYDRGGLVRVTPEAGQ